MIELRHLKHFVAVAEELHFARAAERLGMEQSPLSHSIRNLESDLGVVLFHRTTRRTWLTRAGSRFYQEALRVLDTLEEAKATAQNSDFEQAQRLTIGLTESAATDRLTRFLFELEHQTPRISVDFREIGTTEVVRLLQERIIDVAVTLEAIEVNGLLRKRAWSEPLCLITPIGHPFADRDAVSLGDLASERIVLAKAAVFPGYAGQLDTLLRRYEVRPARESIVKHQNTMISFVAAGRGFAFLPESIAHGLTAVAVLPFREPDAVLDSWFNYRADNDSSALSSALQIGSVIDAGGRMSWETTSPSS